MRRIIALALFAVLLGLPANATQLSDLSNVQITNPQNGDVLTYVAATGTWQNKPGVSGPAGPQGPAGPAGAAGPQGIQGATGSQGPIGLTGAAGAQGNAGPAGPQGQTGLTGAPGPQGIQGVAGPAGSQGPAPTVQFQFNCTVNGAATPC